MLDFEASKLVLIGIVALIFIGPKELPRVLRQVGQAVGKMRRMAAEFQGQFMDAMKEADLENVRQDLVQVKDSANFNLSFNPIREIEHQIGAPVKQSSPTQPDAEPLPAPAAAAEPEPAPLRKIRLRPKPTREEEIPIRRPRLRKLNGASAPRLEDNAQPDAPARAEP